MPRQNKIEMIECVCVYKKKIQKEMHTCTSGYIHRGGGAMHWVLVCIFLAAAKAIYNAELL
jgi:hypothetical protein